MSIDLKNIRSLDKLNALKNKGLIVLKHDGFSFPRTEIYSASNENPGPRILSGLSLNNNQLLWKHYKCDFDNLLNC